MGLGLVTCCDANGCVGHHGHDTDRTAAQIGPDLLLNGREIGVQIDEQPVERGGLALVLSGGMRQDFWGNFVYPVCGMEVLRV